MHTHIYADNAATTKLDPAAFAAMKPWLLEEYGNASQPYAFARNPRKALTEARATIARCIGALPEEIYFTSGGTESDNWVIKGSALSDPEKHATLTTAFEHHAILHAAAAMERLGYPVTYLSPTHEGYITPEILQQSFPSNTRLVSIMLANNELGTVQPIQALCKIAQDHGAVFHTDAVQAVGHIPIDVHELGIDFLSASAHKFNGPKGIGFLYIRKGIELPPYLDGGAQERGHRAGTENIASIVGMAVALQNNCDSMQANISHIQKLETILESLLQDAGIVYCRNGGKNRLPGLMSLSFPGKNGEAMLHRLDLMGISISTGSACDSGNTEISHVLQAIQLPEAHAKGTIRISLSKDNTVSDVERIAEALIGVDHI